MRFYCTEVGRENGIFFPNRVTGTTAYCGPPENKPPAIFLYVVKGVVLGLCTDFEGNRRVPSCVFIAPKLSVKMEFLNPNRVTGKMPLLWAS